MSRSLAAQKELIENPLRNPAHLEENARAVIEAVAKARPHTVKGDYIHSCTISATMSPPVRVDIKEFAVIH